MPKPTDPEPAKSDEPKPPTPTDSGSRRSDQEHPRLRPAATDEAGLAEGEWELIFIAPPPDRQR